MQKLKVKGKRLKRTGKSGPSKKLSLLQRKSHRVAVLLHKAYGSPSHNNKKDPLDELIFIILSLMTTQHSFNRVFDRLKRVAPKWDDVLNLPLSKLKNIIKDAGLSNQKAPRIKKILEKLKHDFGKVSLAPLHKMDVSLAEKYLTSLPGVGLKAAKCVLMYSLGRKVLPVDTHVWRVAKRLGLVDETISYNKIHEILENIVIPNDRFSFHVNAISHGRLICNSKNPRCKGCVLYNNCKYGISHHRQV